MEGNVFYFDFEARLIMWLQKVFGDAGVYIGSAFTYLGETVFLIAILGYLYWCHDKKKGRDIGVAIVVATVWNPLVKNLVLRHRPYMVHEGVRCLKAPTTSEADVYDVAAQGYSFPSGHATNSACVYGYMPFIFRHPAFKIIAGVLPFLIGLSRVILGVHYPTDVFVGWFMGYVIAVGVFFVQKKIKRQWIFHIILFVISAVGVAYCKTEDYYTCLGVMAGLFLAIPFEQKFVNFENTRNPWCCIFRVAGGFALFGLLSVLLKLPFSHEFLDSGTAAAFAVRAIRYMILVFVLIGVYPMCFRPVESLLIKTEKAAA